MGTFLRRILIGLLIIGILAFGALAWLNWQVQRETVTPLQTLNGQGNAGRALTVLNPGLSPFPERIMTAFDNGLAESGWRIDQTTASSETTTDFGEYDLIVLVSPIYGGQVAAPLQAYIARAGDFGGTQVVAIVTSAGDPKEPMAHTRDLIAGNGGSVAGIFGYAVYQPNDEEGNYAGSNTDRAVAMAHDAAVGLVQGLR